MSNADGLRIIVHLNSENENKKKKNYCKENKQLNLNVISMLVKTNEAKIF